MLRIILFAAVILLIFQSFKFLKLMFFLVLDLAFEIGFVITVTVAGDIEVFSKVVFVGQKSFENYKLFISHFLVHDDGFGHESCKRIDNKPISGELFDALDVTTESE